MLVLGCDVNGQIIITVPPSPKVQRIEIMVVRGERVRIGIKANREIDINRSEIQEAIDAQQIQYDADHPEGESYA